MFQIENQPVALIREFLRISIDVLNDGNRELVKCCKTPEALEAIVPELLERIQQRDALQRDLDLVGK